MPDDPLRILERSREADQLVTAGLALARRGDASDHAQLLKGMQSARFYERLDSNDAYDDYPETPLTIAMILDALQENPASAAATTLVALTQQPAFLKEPVRIELLIDSTAHIKPPPPDLVAFWDKYFQPDDGFTPLTRVTLLENGTAEAMELLERKLADPAHREADRVHWMRAEILEHRNDVELLKSCHHMLGGRGRGKGGGAELPDDLKPKLVEALFDHRPDEWYHPEGKAIPPPREEASKDARDLLREIGEYALKKVELSDELKERVETVLEEISQGKP